VPRGRDTWASIISTRRFREEGWISRGEKGSKRRGFRATPSGVLRRVLFYNFIGRDHVSAFWILQRAYVPRPLCSFHPRYILRASSRGISYLGIISRRERNCLPMLGIQFMAIVTTISHVQIWIHFLRKLPRN